MMTYAMNKPLKKRAGAIPVMGYVCIWPFLGEVIAHRAEEAVIKPRPVMKHALSDEVAPFPLRIVLYSVRVRG